MADIEKVTEWLNEIVNTLGSFTDESEQEVCQLAKDALALLKELKETNDKLTMAFLTLPDWNPVIVWCKDCENFVWDSISQNAGSCGIGIGTPPNYLHSKNWFCANGERRHENE